MSRLNKVYRDLSEAVSISWATNGRYSKYIKLLQEKFKLGKYSEIKQSKLPKTTLLKFGPMNLPQLSGKFLYLISDSSGKKMKGRLTHFLVSNSSFDELKEYNPIGDAISKDEHHFIRIPEMFISMNHVMALILGVGKQSFKNANNLLDSMDRLNPNKSKVIDIKEKWELVILTLETVLLGNTSGVVVTGSPGMGKTFTILETLNNLGFQKDEDYVFFQGAKITLTQFYKILYENADKMIIFDDSDSVFRDADGINMMKAALDTTSGRNITYKSPAIDAMKLPDTFKFTGKIIFISNLAMNDIDKALRSRSLIMDLHMTRQQKLDDIMNKYLIMGKETSLTQDEKTTVINFLQVFMEKNPEKPEQLDLRTILKLYDIYDGIKSRALKTGDSPEEVNKLFVKLAKNQLEIS